MKKSILAIITGALLLLHTAVSSATVIDVGIGGTYSQGGVSDLTATTIGLGGAGSFTVDPGFSGEYFDFILPGTGTFSTSGLSTTDSSGNTYYYLESYSAGDSIGVGTFGSHVSTAETSAADDWDTILVGGVTAGVWGSSHDGYLGFLTESALYGWIEYAFTRTGSTSTISFLSAAYDDVAGEGIIAGVSAVPVPAAAWLFGSALLGFFGFSRKKANA